MGTIRRIVPILLVAALLLSSFPLAAFATASDSALYTLTVDNSEVRRGDEVQISVRLDPNISTSYQYGVFIVEYDSDILELKSIEQGSALPTHKVTEDGLGWWVSSWGGWTVMYSNDDLEPLHYSGEVAVLNFQVVEDADIGETEITLQPDSTCGWFGAIGDDFIPVEVTTEVIPAKITVTEETCNAGNKVTSNGITYAWGYGGKILENGGTFTVTPYDADDYHYVIDSLVVDGVARDNVSGSKESVTVEAHSSVFATFAYTLDF